MNFACVLKSGGMYNPSHVYRLRQMLPKEIPLICLTNIRFSFEGVCSLQLRHDYPSWWSKLELFDHPATDKDILYFDLDVDVIGDVMPLFSKKFTMCTDFVLPDRFNSSVMSWGKAPEVIHRIFSSNPRAFINKYTRWPDIGDQAFIERNFEGIQSFPREYVRSYKRECKNGIPKDTRVISYHGRPKPWELT